MQQIFFLVRLQNNSVEPAIHERSYQVINWGTFLFILTASSDVFVKQYFHIGYTSFRFYSLTSYLAAGLENSFPIYCIEKIPLKVFMFIIYLNLKYVFRYLFLIYYL